MISVDPHPLLDHRAIVTCFPGEMGASPAWLVDLLRPDAATPLTPPDDAVRAAVRDLLRHGGFKPTGRSKPASEYLLRGDTSSINPAVDVCNATSLHSGLPISVIDFDLAHPPFRIGLATEGASYVFNAGGQVMDLDGLLCLHDSEGPCANAVKDAQRTKTRTETRRTLTVIWGTTGLSARLAGAQAWYASILERLGATPTFPRSDKLA